MFQKSTAIIRGNILNLLYLLYFLSNIYVGNIRPCIYYITSQTRGCGSIVVKALCY